MSSVSVASFRWLDTLEKEFDKAYVDLDVMFNDLVTESENGDLIDDNIIEFVDNSREKVKIMCSAWAQLVHKSQTIFQVNCKLEAQMVNIKSDLIEAKAFRQASEKELEKLMIELHTSQLQLQKLKNSISNNTSDSSNASSSAGQTGPGSVDVTTDLIQKRLEEELERRFSNKNDHMNIALLKNECEEYKKENNYLREQLVNLNSEIYGARLAAKYLDKELAGRIQQIQLFGKNLKPEEHERLWNQLESEIHLHRHKTVIKACRSKRYRNQQTQPTVTDANTSPPDTPSLKNKSNQDLEQLKKNKLIGQIRTVSLKRRDSKEGLGVSITGGQEHGVPILISEIHENGPAARSNELFVGDAILSANGNDLKDVLHSDAVNILSNLNGDVELKVLFVAPEEDTDGESNSINDLNYPYIDEQDNLLKNGNSTNSKQTKNEINNKVQVEKSNESPTISNNQK